MSQQYSLRWNNHQPNFISMFETLLTTKTLVDVTLAAEGQHLVAHKVVLSACSTYFHSLFVDNPSHHPIVILKDVTFADLRTMVDFMYYGEVNVTEEQLPQVLETAKILKIKGLTEMPDSTSLTRAQGSGDFHSAENSTETLRHSASPSSPTTRRNKRRRKSSSGSIACAINDDNRNEDCGQNLELMREAITFSSVPQQKRRENEDRIDNAQQTGEPSNLNMDQLNMEANAGVLPQDPLSLQAELRQRRSKSFKRQNKVVRYVEELKKQASEPAPSSHQQRTLQKHESYPQYKASSQAKRHVTHAVGSLMIRTIVEAEAEVRSPPSTAMRTPLTAMRSPPAAMRSPPTARRSSPTARRSPPAARRPPPAARRSPSTVPSSHSGSETATASEVESVVAPTPRASHTPAIRVGPPLSCNYCWNTVDEFGRILRRKTQYHCPECRTNLCIVPCFHEYHDGPESVPDTSSAR